MNAEQIQAQLSDPSVVSESHFPLACELARFIGRNPGPQGQALLIRALKVRDSFSDSKVIIDALTRSAGLFPYLDPTRLDLSDQIAFEFHRPIGMEKQNVVLHQVQGEVYREILDGRSVVLSAPTSFGKSLIIDAVIASSRFKKIIVVVPTIALIDETRRRLSRFSEQYKINTHANQEQGENTIFILTQERVVEGLDLEGVDFFVIDEFYKLHPSANDTRSAVLNQAFYMLVNSGAQFYMLGPNINGIPPGFDKRFKCTFIYTDYQTVVSERRKVPEGEGTDFERLAELAKEIEGPTLIFCSSPDRVRKVVRALVESGHHSPVAELHPTVEWIGENYHAEWLFPLGLNQGVAYHHGRLPRALAEMAVRAFNSGSAKFLVCTSTLIEGVNTKAKNVVVFDNTINRKKYDYFTFNNIVGRSGRMGEYFIGNVFLFHDPPEAKLPIIDIPMFTQSEEASESLLLQMKEEDLSDESCKRLERVFGQDVLPLWLIRKNQGVDATHQVELAEELSSDPEFWASKLSWRGMPGYDDLKVACGLIYKYFIRTKGRNHGVSSGAQLTFLMNRIAYGHTARAVLREELKQLTAPSSAKIDEKVEGVLDFMRHWALFSFPRYLRALGNIQEFVLDKAKLPFGDYRMYASKSENLFLDPAIFALDEYGVPTEIGQKLEEFLQPDGDLDLAIERLKSLDLAKVQLSIFERELVEEVVASL